VTVLIVPPLDERPLPTLGPLVCDFLTERAVFGPGSLKGRPVVLDAEKRAVIYRAYEVWPKGHPRAGRRRFPRVGISWRKGVGKTEFAAWIAYAELHPEGPVRCDGFDRWGRPVGRPVADPYIPMVAYTQEQVADLAYGALMVVVSEGPDADLFDVGLDRIIRLDSRGRADGKAVPLSGSPNARDGARTTHQHFDEPHRMVLPSQLAAHETMLANLPKRPLDDPWSLETTTAGQPGQGSVAEKTHSEAQLIAGGEIERPDLFYFHREAGPGHDLSTLAGRVAAIREASGPAADWSDLDGIAAQWDRPGADLSYLERVWTNRWTRSEEQAFDPARWAARRDLGGRIEPGALVVAGFDGARFRDATALVVTDVESGLQVLWGLWERPVDAEDWEVPEVEVTAAVDDLMERFDCWKLYADPPHWTETVGSWEARWPDQVDEWWTNRPKQMAQAVRAFREAIDARQVSHNGDPDLARHIGNAGRHETRMIDDDGRALFTLRKLHADRKFDAAMAAVLSWAARLDAIREGVLAARETFVPIRVR
jgi:hypothetical protein